MTVTWKGIDSVPFVDPRRSLERLRDTLTWLRNDNNLRGLSQRTFLIAQATMVSKENGDELLNPWVPVGSPRSHV